MNPLRIFEVPLHGVSLVEASAGTGKTYNITSLYIRAVTENGLKPANILVVTFTKAAAAELRLRIRQRISECVETLETGQAGGDSFLEELLARADEQALLRLKEALYTFDSAAIYTIHGFCSNLLKEEYLAFRVSPDFSTEGSETKLLTESADEFWRTFVQEYSAAEEKQPVLRYLRSAGINPDFLIQQTASFIGKPLSRMVPETPPFEICSKQLAALESLFQEIQRKFAEEREALFTVVRNESGELKRNQYKPENANLQAFEEWVSAASFNPAFAGELGKFGAAKIQSAFKKNTSVSLPAISYLIDELIGLYDALSTLRISFTAEAVQHILAIYKEKKKLFNTLTYNDLIESVHDGIKYDESGRLAAGIAEKYPFALVDEFQDTDPVQYFIFKSVYNRAGTGLFMIGDPKQAIYNFRGADFYTYLEARADVDTSRRYSLDYNYRSSEQVLNAVNEVFLHRPDPFQIPDIEYRPALYPARKSATAPPVLLRNGEAVPAIHFLKTIAENLGKDESTQRVAGVTAAEIKTLLSGGFTLGTQAVKPSDVAVLVRTNNEAAMVHEALAEQGIKSLLKINRTVYESDEASDLETILSAVANPGHEGQLRMALLTSFFKYRAADLSEFTADEIRWQETVLAFSDLTEIWREQGIRRCLMRLDAVFNIQERLASYKNGERRLTNFNHLIDLLAAEELERHTGISALLRYLNDKIKSNDSHHDEELQRLESDGELVQIVTLHRSKGLEYPVVFLPYLWTGKSILSPGAGKTYSFHRDGKSYISIAGRETSPEDYLQSELEDFAESMRLTYVGFTRAVSALFVPFCETDQAAYSSLAALAAGSEQTARHYRDKILHKKNPAFSSLEEALKDFEDSRNISIREGSAMPAGSRSTEEARETGFNAEPGVFARRDIFDYPRLTSFSGLTGDSVSGHYESADPDEIGTDYDQDNSFSKPEEQSPEVSESEHKTVFSFPKGRDAGTMLHNILEEIDFSSPGSFGEVIEKHLISAGMPASWKDLAERWVCDIVSHKLISGTISLEALEPGKLIKEMEFHFPVKNLHAAGLIQLIRAGKLQKPAEFEPPVHGFMKGFIDLIFEHNGRFYILDYKSNYLGDQPGSYALPVLEKEMNAAYYDVQYHIYTVALHRYLQNRLPGYSYRQHFGGVLYLFLRGLDGTSGENGVYFNRPDEEKINRLDVFFDGKEAAGNE